MPLLFTCKLIPLPLLILCLLSSCCISMSKKERTKNFRPTPSLKESREIALQTPAFKEGNWPTRQWWEQYDSKELTCLIEMALKNNPSILAVREKINFAQNESIIARSALFPLIYFDTSDQWQYLSQTGLFRNLNPNIPLNSSQIDFSLSFTYEFDFWYKYRNLYNAALGRQKAAIAESAQVDLITSIALAQSYFALRTNFVRKRLYQELYDVRLNYFKLQERLLKNALYSKLTPLLSEEAVFQAQQLLFAINQELDVNKHIINILVGRGPDTPLCPEEALPVLPLQMALPKKISSDLLSRRPDLMAQIWRVDALAYDVGAAKAEFWPDINITALIGFQSLSWQKLFQWINNTVGATPGLSLPLYTAGMIGANVDAKKASYNEAVFQYNDLILKSLQQVADLLSIGRAIYGEKERQSQIVANSTSRYNLTLLRKKKGIDSALIAYQFQEELIQKKLEDVELLYQQYIVSVSLIKALGGGYLCAGGSLHG